MSIEDRIKGLPEELEKPALLAYKLFGEEADRRLDEFIDDLVDDPNPDSAWDNQFKEMSPEQLFDFLWALHERLKELNKKNVKWMDAQRDIAKDIIKGGAILLIKEIKE